MKQLQKAFFLIIILSSAAALFQTVRVEAQQQNQRHSNISLGSSLNPTTNSSWLSPSGLYAFGFYRERNGYAVGVFIAGIPEKTVVWTANRNDPPVPSSATLTLTSDGFTILQSQNTSIAVTLQLAYSASMLDSGNFVVYNSDQDVIWQSFDLATDTLLPGQRLAGEHLLESSVSETDHSVGLFSLIMHFSGNLAQYSTTAAEPSSKYAYWQSGTQGNGVALNLDSDGHLYLLNATSSILYNITEAEPPTKEEKIHMMKIDVDGILRVYSRTLDPKDTWSILWNSTADKCDPQGLCGLNAFCVQKDIDADCRCVPGFAPVVPGKWSAGCASNFAAPSCKNTDGNANYTMIQLERTIWEDLSYWLRHISSKECEEACLQDCTCEVALFKDGLCRKQRLPLRFGRRKQDDSNVAFIKVGKSEEPNLKTIPGGHDNPTMKRKKALRVDILIVGVSLSAFGLMALAISGVLVYRNHVFWAYKKIVDEKRNHELGEDVAPQTFTLAELELVTNGFKEELGRGAFGTVFKGIISYNHKDVAVKRLDKVLTEGEREFQTEIKVIGRTHHRNLVRLIGYCLDGPHRLLVYEYMSNGSLADFLFTPENRPGWDERIGIALDVARGILYLHEECETRIIHCDIKPQNILMDEHGRAKISDFGLAKLLKPDQTNTFTAIRGTRGYVAPEWHRKLPITVKADVYSFGVTLLEIICCRKCLVLSLSEEEAVLEEWVYDCFKVGELGKLVGDEEVDKRKLERMVKVGLWCIQDEPSLRPSMKKVMMMLEGTVDIPVPPSPTSFLSAV